MIVTLNQLQSGLLISVLFNTFLRFCFVPLFETYFSLSSCCLALCVYSYVTGKSFTSWRSGLCRRCPMGPSSMLSSGYQLMLQQCPLCGLHAPFSCGGLTPVGTLVDRAEPPPTPASCRALPDVAVVDHWWARSTPSTASLRPSVVWLFRVHWWVGLNSSAIVQARAMFAQWHLTGPVLAQQNKTIKVAAAGLCVPRCSQLPPVSLGVSSGPGSRTDPGTFQTTASAVGLRACEILHSPFKNGIFISCSPQALLSGNCWFSKPSFPGSHSWCKNSS